MADFQPGGTFTIATNKWAGHVVNVKKDELGCWSSVTLIGKKERLITFVTAYRVCDNTLANAEPSTCWMQQWRHLKKN
eukprot:10868338-Ditylum_brightwellii.AAC.1